MPNYSLIFARSLEHADNSAVTEWHWQRSDELHFEYRRPDTGERARYVHDLPGTLQGLRWNTRVYLVDGWCQRSDASQIMGYLDSGFFKEEDPVLPPPRVRARRDDVLNEVRKTLSRLERR